MADEPVETESGKCPVCGSETLAAGSLMSGQPVTFLPDEIHGLRRLFQIGGRNVRAFACAECGYIQLRLVPKAGGSA